MTYKTGQRYRGTFYFDGLYGDETYDSEFIVIDEDDECIMVIMCTDNNKEVVEITLELLEKKGIDYILNSDFYDDLPRVVAEEIEDYIVDLYKTETDDLKTCLDFKVTNIKEI